jgi:hypothetical protein
MKTNLKLSTLLLFIFSAAAISPVFAQVKTIVDVTKSYTGINKIEVSGGQLEVEYIGGSSSDVSVSAFLESTNTDQDIVFITLGDVLKISHKVNNNNNWNNKTKGYIKISGPENMNLDIKGGSGKIAVENVAASQTLLSVGSGSLFASNIDGDIHASAGSGSAKIQEVKGSLEYSSGSGGISATSIDGTVHVSLTSGNAKLDDITELGDLKVTSGNFNATNAGLGASTKINGTSGNFRIQTFSNLKDFNYDLSATSGNITVGNSRSGRNLIIDNGAEQSVKGSVTSGNISIVN